MKMIKLTKNVIGAGAAAVALVGMSVPAVARDYNRDGDGISAGEVIAGAVILGGIAAVLSSNSKNDRYYDRDNGYRGGGYDDRDYGYSRRGGGSRAAVNQCIRDVEGYSNRYNRAKVTEIRDIERTQYGYKVTGKIVVRDGYRSNDRYDRDDRYNRYDRDNRYDRGDNYGRYGRGYESGYDKGRFSCYVERGRVVDINYKGLDQWR
jgi:hypothetical protein